MSEIISKEKNEVFYLSSPFEIATEVSIKKGGRIDLLLSNSNQAIITENKVCHHLNNDLDDYWSSVTQTEKQGASFH